jgi:hypothetical protein
MSERGGLFSLPEKVVILSVKAKDLLYPLFIQRVYHEVRPAAQFESRSFADAQDDKLERQQQVGGGTMKKAELKGFGKPDEIREFPNGRLDLITIGGRTVGRATLKPGWQWSKSVQPIAKTVSCEAPHFQYHVSGVLMVRMDDGTEFECKAGDVSLLPSGHDAWVVGDEPVVIVDFQGMIDYAKEK